MTKILAIIGSERKRNTYMAVQAMEKRLKSHMDADFEYLMLSDHHLEFCRGCKLCFDRGEGLCPRQDDRDVIIAKIEEADGVIVATPNYAFQVSARVKNLLDRLAFVYHRPRFFGKTFTAIVSQGVFGGNDVRKYLENAGGNMGFATIKGCCVTSLEPMTDEARLKLEKAAAQTADRFAADLKRKGMPSPSLLRVIMFRMTRTMLANATVRLRDYHHFEEQGWLTSAYYYPVKLGPIKSAVGWLADRLAGIMA